MENVVTVIFDVESEAYQAFTELRQQPFGEGYVLAEAALLKREGDAIIVADSFDAAAITSDDTSAGMVIGALVGILGGPLGVLLGAGVGAFIGSHADAVDTINSASLLEVAASKLFDGEVAIIALVQEEEPAFDAAFAKYQTTIIRHFAVDVMEEVEYGREVLDDLSNQAKQRMRADRKAEKQEKREERKAERQAKREERKAKIQAKFDGIKEKRAAHKADIKDAVETANAEFVSETKEIMGE